MPRKANVYSIVVASPSDVGEERIVVAEIIEAWNYAHSATRGVILEPVRWETHTYPELGQRPQSIINSQIIDRSDILIGIFGIQLGTDTGVAPSGTVEEIRCFTKAGKPVLVYFSDRPVPPRQLDPKKYKRLKEFREALYKEGLVGSFSDLSDLREKVSGDLSRILNKVIPMSRRSRETRITNGYDRDSVFKAALRSAKEKPLIHGTRYTRNDIITNDGDVRILEHWEGVVSFDGRPLREIPTVFMSRAGHQATWQCQSLVSNQSVEWLWEMAEDGNFVGRFVFDPPLTSSPVSFTTERFVFNGVSFNKAERMQATDGQETEEELCGTYRNVWEECLFGIKFPEHRFPRKFDPEVYGGNGDRLDNETALFLRTFKPWPEIQTLTFGISHPIPDIKYSVRWALPEDSSSQLSTTETGFVEEVTRRLVGLRNGGLHPEELSALIRALRVRFTSLISSSGDLGFSVVLYVYDRQKSGLTCVATLDAEDVERNWANFFFKPGRGVVGRAFRRRDIEIFFSGNEKSQPDAFEEIVGQEYKPTCIVCVPLFLKDKTDRVLAILSFESGSPSPEVKNFLAQPAVVDIIRSICGGSYEQIADALSVPTAKQFWIIGQVPEADGQE